MHSFGTPGIVQLVVAMAATIPLGYAFSWILDRLLLKRLLDDRVTGIALSCALTFILLMVAVSIILTRNSPVPDGPIIVPPLGYAISFIAGLGVVGALRMKIYGREYETNDDQAIFDFDWDDPTLYDEEVVDWEDRHAGRNYFYRHWVGHLSLPMAYWVNGALVSVLLVGSAEFLSDKIHAGWGSLRMLAFLSLFFLTVSLVVWVWSSVGIWRAAHWHRRRSGAAAWGVAARAFVLLGAATTAFRSGDIALQAAELGNLAVGRDSVGEIARMEVSSDGRELRIRGALASGATDRFKPLIEKNPDVRVVILTSFGGRMMEAERIASLIRERGLDTRVDDHCESACISLLLAGRDRSAPNQARIGFHQPSFPGLNAREMRGAIDETRAAYIAAGVEPAFVWRAMATPADGMWYPSPDELVAANVLTGTDIVVAARYKGKATVRAIERDESLSDKRLRLDFQQGAAQINASVPVKVDEITTLDRASASGFTLTYFYTVRAPELDLKTAEREMDRLVHRQTCSNPGMVAAVRDGGRFVYSYRNGGGRPLFEITVSDCFA